MLVYIYISVDIFLVQVMRSSPLLPKHHKVHAGFVLTQG